MPNEQPLAAGQATCLSEKFKNQCGLPRKEYTQTTFWKQPHSDLKFKHKFGEDRLGERKAFLSDAAPFRNACGHAWRCNEQKIVMA